MKLKFNYFFIPLITILVAIGGSFFTTKGMGWYDTSLIQPEITLPKIAFPIAWNIIFICTTISALILWNKGKQRFLFGTLFIINGFLNILWCLLFFGLRMILFSIWEMVILEITIFLLIFLSWKISRLASFLLLPYFLWVGFATYLTYQIFILN